MQDEEIDNAKRAEETADKKHHEKPEAKIRETEEELENLLAEEEQDMPVQQQGYIEAAAGQLQKPAQEQEASVPPVEPEQPPGDEGAFHPSRTVHHVRQPLETGPPSGPEILRQRKLAQEQQLEQLPETGPPSSEPEILRQRKLAQEQQQEKEAGSRSPPQPHSPLHSGGRTLAQQRRAAQERQQHGQEQQKPEEGTLRHTPSPGHSGGRILAQQRQAAKERQGQEQQKAEDHKTQQKAQQLHRNHGNENLSQQRKFALKRKNKGQVSQAYEEPQHHERGDDVRRLAPDDRKEPHHDIERGRVHSKGHDKKL